MRGSNLVVSTGEPPHQRRWERVLLKRAEMVGTGY